VKDTPVLIGEEAGWASGPRVGLDDMELLPEIEPGLIITLPSRYRASGQRTFISTYRLHQVVEPETALWEVLLLVINGREQTVTAP
jgi:hypothetical protein